jgi:hypothetical protein
MSKSNLNVAAAGDSWNVDLPFDFATGGGIAKALFERCLGITDYPNIAHAGNSTDETEGLDYCLKLEAMLPGKDILLYSSGGDDIAGPQFKVMLNECVTVGGDVSRAVNWERFYARMKWTLACFEDLIEIRDRLAPQCWIVTTSYDFPPASVMGRGVLMLGPWLQPGLIYCGWTDPNDQSAIVKQVLAEFQNAMSNFAFNNPRWLHVNTQGTCHPEHWANELHLTSDGCLEIARVINAGLLPVLDQIASRPH